MCDLKDQLNAARDEYDESEKQNRKTEKECDKAQIKLDQCEQRLVHTKEISAKRKQTIDSLRVKLASSKENATNVKNIIENEHKNIIENEHKTKKNDFDHKNNLLKLEVKMLKESVLKKKAMIT